MNDFIFDGFSKSYRLRTFYLGSISYLLDHRIQKLLPCGRCYISYTSPCTYLELGSTKYCDFIMAHR
jgi:hypothetical protein